MSKVLFRKHLGALKPGDPRAEDAIRSLKQGEWIWVELRRPRNVKHHRKWWALMSKVAENLDGIDAETLCEVVKVRIGHVQVIKTSKGEVHIPKSISFGKMGQDEFERFYDRAVAFILSDVLPGVAREELDEEINAILEGGTAWQAA